ncbi:MAG TPA: hypothetical protein VNC84_04465 [Gammaproteobacteria bacterium]|jgi:hypothetical protein|nr:hypothetical protein [Gammaproteobacteria bacterium]
MRDFSELAMNLIGWMTLEKLSYLVGIIIPFLVWFLKNWFFCDKSARNELDRAAFSFLTTVPHFGRIGKDEFIRNFQSELVNSVYIKSGKNRKKYDYYIKLVQDFDAYNKLDFGEEAFIKIKREAEKLAKRVTLDQLTTRSYMQELYEFEAKVYLKRNVFFIINSGRFDKKHPPFLLYYDTIYSGSSGGYKDEINAARKIVSKNFNQKNGQADADQFYLDENKSSCTILYPKTDYNFIEKKKSSIKIKYKGREIVLYYEKPQSLNELQLRE